MPFQRTTLPVREVLDEFPALLQVIPQLEQHRDMEIPVYTDDNLYFACQIVPLDQSIEWHGLSITGPAIIANHLDYEDMLEDRDYFGRVFSHELTHLVHPYTGLIRMDTYQDIMSLLRRYEEQKAIQASSAVILSRGFTEKQATDLLVEDVVQDDWTPEEVDTVRGMLRRLVQRGASYLTKQAQEKIKHPRYVATGYTGNLREYLEGATDDVTIINRADPSWYFFEIDLFDQKKDEYVNEDPLRYGWLEDGDDHYTKEEAEFSLDRILTEINGSDRFAGYFSDVEQEEWNPYTIKLSTDLSDLTRLDYEGRYQVGQTIQQRLQEIDSELETLAQKYENTKKIYKQSSSQKSQETAQVSFGVLDLQVSQKLLDRWPFYKTAQRLNDVEREEELEHDLV